MCLGPPDMIVNHCICPDKSEEQVYHHSPSWWTFAWQLRPEGMTQGSAQHMQDHLVENKLSFLIHSRSRDLGTDKDMWDTSHTET